MAGPLQYDSINWDNLQQLSDATIAGFTTDQIGELNYKFVRYFTPEECRRLSAINNEHADTRSLAIRKLILIRNISIAAHQTN